MSDILPAVAPDSLKGLDIEHMTLNAQNGGHEFIDSILSLDSFPKQVAAMQAMEKASKNNPNLPDLQLSYSGHKYDAVLEANLLMSNKGAMGALGLGTKLIYAEKYDPMHQTITPWKHAEK